MTIPAILSFDEHYFARIWGGRKLASIYGKNIPEGQPIGEAWLITDHAQAVSVVNEGPIAGSTLRELLETDPAAILGVRARLTIHGRFPLLLKLLDARDVLSVQVHPDDATAKALNEPDVGKTEMWHVLQREDGAQLICGLREDATPATLEKAVVDGGIEDLMHSFPVTPGDALYVPAGTVHAIGAGNLLAEIQQNSDLTYRLYDWGRTTDDGKPRELHIEKSGASIHFGLPRRGPARGLRIEGPDGARTWQAACPHFAACLYETKGGDMRVETRGESFHILLGVEGDLRLASNGEEHILHPGATLLVTGQANEFTLRGTGACLGYHVPDMDRDVITPLLAAGYTRGDIQGVTG